MAGVSLNNLIPIATERGVNIGSQAAQEYLEQALGDTTYGRIMGNLFGSTTNTFGKNLLAGNALTEGLTKNVGSSLVGSGVGITSNLVGRGITSLGGNSALSRGLGAGISTGLGTVGGTALTNLITQGSVAGATASKLFGTAGNIWSTGKATFDTSGKLVGKAAGAINPYALGATVLGTALGAATGPSKEYGGKYGSITQTADTIYDLASVGANFIPGVGLAISGAMVLNKGLSNIFGSTDGMTLTDAILGSAFMPAPIKWVNMFGAKKTGSFNNQSWLNSEKATNFMQDGFGNLNERFDKARQEAGKTYGTFSLGARRSALKNLDFANMAWSQIMEMADLNELQNIRSLDMASINNLRYALTILGGYSPIYIGKLGMKIFNNATNHKVGMRLLSGAALIDNKQMILSNLSA